MRGVLLAISCAALVGVALQGSGDAAAPFTMGAGPLTHHLETALSHMDRGSSSPDYRESLAFLRAHATDVTAEVSPLLLEERGSFRKWQVTYLVGEFGDEDAITLLGLLIDEPLPQPQTSREEPHAIDLAYNEELASRVQAVMSTARIASHRPQLRDQVVAQLVATARQVSSLRSTAMFELQKLLGLETQTLRGQFSPEDTKHFDPFVPPPELQGVLRHRMDKHRRQERELRETRQPICHHDQN